jgi:hypothetical protein
LYIFLTNPLRLRREAECAVRAASSVPNEEVRKLAERREAMVEARREAERYVHGEGNLVCVKDDNGITAVNSNSSCVV